MSKAKFIKSGKIKLKESPRGNKNDKKKKLKMKNDQLPVQSENMSYRKENGEEQMVTEIIHTVRSD
jgi:hypothetical protein